MTAANALYVIGLMILICAGAFSIIATDVIDQIKGKK